MGKKKKAVWEFKLLWIQIAVIQITVISYATLSHILPSSLDGEFTYAVFIWLVLNELES